MNTTINQNLEGIAIIGMIGKFPGADTVAQHGFGCGYLWRCRPSGKTSTAPNSLVGSKSFNCPYRCRSKHRLVGHCTNLLPLRTQIDRSKSFIDYRQQRRSTILDADEHQQFTCGSLVGKLALARDPSRIPLVPIVFNLDRAATTDRLFTGLELTSHLNPREFEAFELFINAVELADKIVLECQCNTNLFDRATIQRLLAEFDTLLRGIIADPTQLISQLPLLTTAARQQLLVDWNATQADPDTKCLHQLVDIQAQLTPAAAWNMSGPTETTIWSTIDRITGTEPQTSIGRPTNGRYFLVGYSCAGLVVCEIAQQLDRQGHKVALLALLDRISPTSIPTRPSLLGAIGIYFRNLWLLDTKSKWLYLLSLINYKFVCRCVTGNIEIHHLPTVDRGILKAPSVQLVAAKIRLCLDRLSVNMDRVAH